jgi:hypothetical protein
VIRDCFIYRQLGGASRSADEAGFNLPEHLMRPPAVTREIKPLEGAFGFPQKIIGKCLIIFDSMTKHKGTTEERYSIRSSLNCGRDLSKTAAIESVGDVVDSPTA